MNNLFLNSASVLIYLFIFSLRSEYSCVIFQCLILRMWDLIVNRLAFRFAIVIQVNSFPDRIVLLTVGDLC